MDGSPAQGSMNPWDRVPMEEMEKGKKHGDSAVGDSGVPGAPNAILPQDKSYAKESGPSSPPPEATPIPDSPTFSVQLASPKSLWVRTQPPFPPFDNNRTPTQAPLVDHGRLDHLSYGQIHELRKRQGYNGKDSKSASKTRLASKDDKGN